MLEVPPPPPSYANVFLFSDRPYGEYVQWNYKIVFCVVASMNDTHNC